MQVPTANRRRQQVWPLQPHPPRLELGQVQVLLPDAYVAGMQLLPADPVKLGFMCGSLPVPTFNPSDITAPTSQASEAALIPAISKRSAAPRYRVLPTETDLNMPPSNCIETEPIFSVSTSQEAAGSCKAWAGSYLSQPVARKCEALAVNALAGYGDDIDVVAPVDILKQLFKTPYCKARLSLAVHRIGRTLVLNSGPDEWRNDRPGAKLPSQKKSHAQAMERTLFSKFIQHSLYGDSCDSASTLGSDSRRSSGNLGVEELDESRMAPHHEVKHRVSLGHYRRSRCGGFEEVQKKRFVEEQQRETEYVQKERPAEGQQRPPSDGYLRVLFWQFQNLRMLLGSDLLLFSNENHSAVSLHLLEIERQVTPLMWLDAWLDNVMASIPELAVCYHRNGVVQGYELLKTDDIFLVKGLAEDGTAFFHPHVIQKNASSVLRFLQDNCKQDPGTYWLLKNSGEDLIQLFDLSVISKTCSSHDENDKKTGSTLPSTRNSCSEQYSLPLAMLLYRLTRRLSQSQDPADWRKCAKLFGKCLEFMEEQEHLIIRASAHEHVARLILTSFKEIGSMCEPLLLESTVTEGTVSTEVKQVLELHCSFEEPLGDEATSSTDKLQEVCVEKETSNNYEADNADVLPNGGTLLVEALITESHLEDTSTLSSMYTETGSSEPDGSPVDSTLPSMNSCLETYTPLDVVGTPTSDVEPLIELGCLSTASSSKSLLALTDPVSARLAAVHHISQAIKALRWQRQLDVGDRSESTLPKPSLNQQFPICICGEVECVAICDFREIGIGAQMDEKLWQLMLLLGEAYFSLGQAYKDEGQLSRALKSAELACLVCGSMPQVNHRNTISFNAEKISTSPWDCSIAQSKKGLSDAGESSLGPCHGKVFEAKDRDQSCKKSSVPKGTGTRHLFCGQLWTFVGDVYVETQGSLGEGTVPHEQGSQFEELTMAQEVMKEVKRLKKKIGQLRASCEMCSLTSCSCQSDRARSGDSASSCNSSSINPTYGRKHNKNGNNRRRNKIREAVSAESKEKVDGCETRAHFQLRVDVEKVYEVSRVELNIETATSKLLSPKLKTGKITDADCNNPSDIYSYLRRSMTTDWEVNLSAAVDCYSNACVVYSGISECGQDLDLTLRKKGWACNELGRMRLAHGQIKLAEVAFANAIEAFRDVKDPVNVVLVYCNLGHGQRAAAEALANKLSAWEDSDFPTFFVQTIAEAKILYGEALKFYGIARQELLGTEEKVEQPMGGLWSEVHTQLAHTYLRLGMLLAREDKFVYACGMNSRERRLGIDESGGRLLKLKDATPTKDAITKALEIYKSLGSLRAQEAAFAQYQLACHHRDTCSNAAMQVDDIVVKKVEPSSFQKAKRHASLAELYWLKALDFYQPETHAGMFLDILMERSALCLVMTTSFHQNQMLEQALSLLLEGRKALVPESRAITCERMDRLNLQSGQERPSAAVIGKLTKQVQMLLKNMLASAMQLNKSSQSSDVLKGNGKNNDYLGHGDLHSGLGRVWDVAKLKQMYRLSLQSQEELNLEMLFNLWVG